MQQFAIKKLVGISTKTVAESQDRGTLRRADGLICTPTDALSTAPTWSVCWGLSGLIASMATALSGATANKVHFVTITDSTGNIVLVAWDLSTTSARGIWVVASGTAAPDFTSGSGVVLASPNTTAYRDKSAALFWYGTWVGSRLFLGNGTDINAVWESGALALLGPSSEPTDLSNPSRFRFPPCKAFAMGPDGVIYAGGNVSAPLRLYASDPPSYSYPTISGTLTTDRSWTDLNRYVPQGSAIAALSPTQQGCMVHLGNGGVLRAFGKEKSTDGNLMIQGPTANYAGAFNQACVTTNGFTGTSYFGADSELYGDHAISGQYGDDAERDDQIETHKSSGQWNRLLYRGGLSLFRHFLLDDTLNGRVWLCGPLTLAQKPGLYSFDRKSQSMTGPHYFPRLSCAAELLRQDLPGSAQPLANGSPFVTVGVSVAGALMFADLGKVGELALDSPGASIGTAYQIKATIPTATIGLANIGVYDSGDGSLNKFAMVASSGEVYLLADPWSDWTDNGTTVPTGITNWFLNAQLAIAETSAEDYGSPSAQKDICSLRQNWRFDQRVYCGVAVQSANIRDYRWIGTPFGYEEQYAMITSKGTRATFRLMIVAFNGSPSCLPDCSVGLSVGTPA